MACLSPDEVVEFLEGRLAAEATAALEEHAQGCDACRALLAESVRAAFPEPGPASRYRIVRPIGAGGMGVVYEAHDLQLHRAVALKMLRPAGDAEGQRERLLREARAMAKLSHPNVLAVHDVGMLGDAVFLAMELVEGRTLTAWLHEKKRSWQEILEVFLAAARGLAAAHAAGLVHRDFKPDNVLVGKDGRTRVTDFGLARTVAAPFDAGPGGAARVVASSSLAGSPAYMAPEQMRGEPVDERADVFSFCVALHEGLFGVRPFEGETLSALEQSIARGEVRNPRARIPSRLRRALLRGLRASAAERYGSMEALISALEEARRPAVALPLAALGAAAAVAAAFLLRSTPPPVEPDERIRSLLAQMEKETDAARLSEMDGRLGQLIVDAQRSRDQLRRRGGAAPLPPSDELDADLRSLLRKFGAETYLVPPIFKERVRSHLARLLKNPQLARIYQRKQQYWPLLARELEAVGLPEEMGYVVWTESHFDPAARSPLGSFGLWQLSPQVARSYGLRVDAEVDERGDPAKDTRAAARCFADLLAQFGADSFMLALASYNSGEQRVQRALQQVALEPGGFSRDKRDFWHLYRRKLLSQETSEYVPSVLAAAIVGSHPQRYGLLPGR
jgi:serine/threonine protein kinase